jgi:hypothetical protein
LLYNEFKNFDSGKVDADTFIKNVENVKLLFVKINEFYCRMLVFQPLTTLSAM